MGLIDKDMKVIILTKYHLNLYGKEVNISNLSLHQHFRRDLVSIEEINESSLIVYFDDKGDFRCLKSRYDSEYTLSLMENLKFIN